MIDLVISLIAFQGTAIMASLPTDQLIDQAHLNWDNRTYDFVKIDSNHMATLIGIDLDQTPGIYNIPIEILIDNNLHEGELVLEVKKWDFPTTKLTVEPRYVQLSPESQVRANREANEISALYARNTDQNKWIEPFIIPLEGIDQGSNFGHRRIFNNEPRSPHSGADLAANSGTPILASSGGQVILAKDLFFSGNAVFIDHGASIFTTYLHLSEIFVKAGDVVEKGQLIGNVGSTGRVTGPHLHWGARIKNARVDPFTLASH
jgi:murein DD-endopeptidase MepM/ murein hydrolase activator NlpD